MYDIVQILLSVAILGVGLFMAICPKKATKASKRDDPKVVKITRISGILVAVLGLVYLAADLLV